MRIIGAQLNVKTLKIIFVGIGVDNKTESELKALSAAAKYNS
jgi:hypothetical protein